MKFTIKPRETTFRKAKDIARIKCKIYFYNKRTLDDAAFVISQYIYATMKDVYHKQLDIGVAFASENFIRHTLILKCNLYEHLLFDSDEDKLQNENFKCLCHNIMKFHDIKPKQHRDDVSRYRGIM